MSVRRLASSYHSKILASQVGVRAKSATETGLQSHRLYTAVPAVFHLLLFHLLLFHLLRRRFNVSNGHVVVITGQLLFIYREPLATGKSGHRSLRSSLISVFS
jgi:hypothetical protein